MFIITLARSLAIMFSYFLKGSGPCLQIYLCQFSLKVHQMEISLNEKQTCKSKILCTKYFMGFFIVNQNVKTKPKKSLQVFFKKVEKCAFKVFIQIMFLKSLIEN